MRAAVSRLSTLAAAPLISKKKLRVTDPMSGFFVIHRRCIEGLTFQTSGFKLLLEILVRGRIGKAQRGSLPIRSSPAPAKAKPARPSPFTICIFWAGSRGIWCCVRASR